ncbi:alpha/beta-hydrolase [Testicularia cyperi]|uniref:Protein phosphatase methylesterase 1 n=1 Tax=Testicularia cyperi TaxID=1882483 RepID=A0A317XXL2_9BASI|nr:alpha/beta-hydrolase [Testicularia cyperi]
MSSDLRTSILRARLDRKVPPHTHIGRIEETNAIEDDANLMESEAADALGAMPPPPARHPAIFGSSAAPPSTAASSESSSSLTFSTPSIAAGPSSGASVSFLSRKTAKASQDFSPHSAEGFFQEALEVDVPLTTGSATFRVYYTPPRPAIGSRKQSAHRSTINDAIDITSAALPTLRPGILRSDRDESPEADEPEPAITGPSGASSDPGTIFLLHHGAGFSALSYALTAAEITQSTKGEVGILAYDCRGHGRTRLHAASSGPPDMSLDTLSTDLIALLKTMFPDPDAMPSLVMVGHSMGGSVVVSAAHALIASGFRRVSGVAVLDVVEGTAMDALPVMRSVVQSRPAGFSSVEAAIRWHVDSKTVVNLTSARVSVPPLVAPNPKWTAVDATQATSSDFDESEPHETLKDEIEEDERPAAGRALPYRYCWRTDLLATEPYWRGWFEGLSSRFLGTRSARLLLLAGTDRLDRELMIGQMQGKYQLEVISDVGHSLQEDAPDRTARILVDFWRRNERVQIPSKLIKKVGEQ